jgi:S-adenosylmethionine/arginine decarboxylase-like enzyme
MVQIDNINIVGKEMIIDCNNIESDKLKTVEMIKRFMDKVIDELKLNVVGECSHQFKKIKCPMVIQ